MRRTRIGRALLVLAVGALTAVAAAGAAAAEGASAASGAAPECQYPEADYLGGTLTYTPADLCTDADGDELSFVWVSVPSRGTLTVSGARLAYTSPLVAGAHDDFRFRVTDGVNEATGGVTVQHQDPAIGTPVDDAYTVAANSVTVLDVKANDLAAAGNGVVVTEGPTGSSVQVGPDGTVTFDTLGVTGTVVFKYRLTNPATGHSGPAEATVTITVTP